ncbi:hypothetical protein B0H14DRAFT_2645919 [Mycena olivaceomarginata]|nr:hypothetical protein B0H14DRAFT_2645919 [Mycena olivaceomarginata]
MVEITRGGKDSKSDRLPFGSQECKSGFPLRHLSDTTNRLPNLLKSGSVFCPSTCRCPAQEAHHPQSELEVNADNRTTYAVSIQTTHPPRASHPIRKRLIVAAACVVAHLLDEALGPLGHHGRERNEATCGRARGGVAEDARPTCT